MKAIIRQHPIKIVSLLAALNLVTGGSLSWTDSKLNAQLELGKYHVQMIHDFNKVFDAECMR